MAPAPLIEFPADDANRARRFWDGLLGTRLAARSEEQGAGWVSEADGLRRAWGEAFERLKKKLES